MIIHSKERNGCLYCAIVYIANYPLDFMRKNLDPGLPFSLYEDNII